MKSWEKRQWIILILDSRNAKTGWNSDPAPEIGHWKPRYQLLTSADIDHFGGDFAGTSFLRQGFPFLFISI